MSFIIYFKNNNVKQNDNNTNIKVTNRLIVSKDVIPYCTRNGKYVVFNEDNKVNKYLYLFSKNDSLNKMMIMNNFKTGIVNISKMIFDHVSILYIY